MEMKRDEEERQEPIMGCCICFENLAETPPEVQIKDHPDEICIAPCGHIFHRGCIIQWLQGDRNDLHDNCPSCRANFEPENLKAVHFLETTVKDPSVSLEQERILIEARLKVTKRSFLSRLTKLEAELRETKEKLEQREDKINRLKPQLTSVKKDLGEAREKLKVKKNRIKHLKLLLNLKDVGVSAGTRLGQLRRNEILNSRPRWSFARVYTGYSNKARLK